MGWMVMTLMHDNCWWCNQGYTHAPMIYPKFIPFNVQPEPDPTPEWQDAWEEACAQAIFGEASGQ